jgi:hypothetical protein
MAPDVCVGDHIFISPTTDLLPGMVAAIFTRDGKCGIKRLVTVPPAKPWERHPESTIEIVLFVNQASPPQGYGLPMGMIETVHGAIGVVRDGVFSPLKPTLARPTADSNPASHDPVVIAERSRGCNEAEVAMKEVLAGFRSGLV